MTSVTFQPEVTQNKNVGSWSENFNKLKNEVKIRDLAKLIFTSLSLVFLTYSCPYIMPISCIMGMAAPDLSMRTTNRIWTSLFDPIVEPEPLDLNDFEKKVFRIKQCIKRCQPLILAFYMGFFSLPVVTIQTSAFLVGMRLGAARLRIDLFSEIKENR